MHVDLGISGSVQEVIVANTIPVPESSQFPCLTVLSVANLLGVRVTVDLFGSFTFFLPSFPTLNSHPCTV